MNQVAEELSAPIEQTHRSRQPQEGGILNAIRNMSGWVRAAVAAVGLLSLAEAGCASSKDACRKIDFFSDHAIRDGYWEPQKNCKKQLQEASEIINSCSICEDIPTRMYAFETLAKLAEICGDDNMAAEYYREGLKLAPQSSSKRVAAIENQLQRLLMLLETKKPACQKMRITDVLNPHTGSMDMRGGIRIIEQNIDKCSDDFIRLQAYVKLGEWYEKGDPFLAEKYYREALKAADSINEKIGPFFDDNSPRYGRTEYKYLYVQYKWLYDLMSDHRIDTNLVIADGKLYIEYRARAENKVKELAALSDDEKRRRAERHNASRKEGVIFFRAGEDPTRPSAIFGEGARTLRDMGAAVAPTVGALVEGIVVAVEKMTPSAGNETSATCSSCGEIEVQIGSTGFLSLPCTDTGSATRVGERESATCWTLGGPVCVIENLAPGKYAVRAERDGGCNKREAGPVEVTVESGQRVKVDFSRRFKR